MIKNDLDSNFEIVDKTFLISKVNIWSIFIILPIYLVFSIITNIICENQDKTAYDIIIIILIFIVGAAIHEFVHGFVWHIFCDDKWKSIGFGFNLKTFTPYATCREKLSINHYRLGTIAPGIITGVIPFIVALILKNDILAVASTLLICGACGDWMILYTISKEKSTSLVIDHPTMCGCDVYRKKS